MVTAAGILLMPAFYNSTAKADPKDEYQRTALAADTPADGGQRACPLGVPVPDALPSGSTPVNGFANPNPTLYGNLTGGDASVDSPLVYISTENGYILKYDMTDKMNPILLEAINTFTPGLTGVAVTPNGFAVTDDTNIYEGTIDAGTWNETNLIPKDFLSNITDVDWGLGRYFISTTGDGILTGK